jgi:hypothetical protein
MHTPLLAESRSSVKLTIDRSGTPVVDAMQNAKRIFDSIRSVGWFGVRTTKLARSTILGSVPSRSDTDNTVRSYDPVHTRVAIL